MDSKIEKIGLHENDWPMDRENSERESEITVQYTLFLIIWISEII